MTGIRLKAYSAAAAVFALDRLAKWIVETRVSLADTCTVIPGFFDIVRAQNRGVAFGLFNESTFQWRTTLLVLVSVAAVVVVSTVVWKARQLPPLSLWGFRADSGRRRRQFVRPHSIGTRHRFPGFLHPRLPLARL